MFLLRIIVFIVIIAFAYPYVKKSSDFIMKRVPDEVKGSISNIAKQVKNIKEINKK
jgi:hypothetical protein